MEKEAAWRVDTKWVLSSLSVLMAILFIVALGYALIFTDRSGQTIEGALYWPVLPPLILFPFITSALLGCRLLIPTFAGAPPRSVAIVMTTWPLALGGGLVWSSAPGALLFAAVGIVWALVMPLPGRTVIEDSPIRGGAIAGLAFGAILAWQGALWAIVWCAWRLYKDRPAEVLITALFATIAPVLVAMSVWQTASRRGEALYLAVEVAILGCLFVAGALLSRLPRRENDSMDEYEDEDSEETEIGEA